MHIFFLIWTIVVLYGVIVVDLMKKTIVNLQKRAGRFILNIDFDTPSTFLFSQLKWKTFTERVIYQKAIQMYKTLSVTSPNYLKIPFTLTSDIHSRTLRSSHETQLYIPKPRIELFIRNTFVFSGTSNWKSISDFIRNSSNCNLFKVRYLKWYQSSG